MTDTAVDDIVVPVEPVFYEAPPVDIERVVVPGVAAPVEHPILGVVDIGPVEPLVDLEPQVEERVVPPRPWATVRARAATLWEERQWPTWQLVTAAAVAVLIGLLLGRATTSSSGARRLTASGTSATRSGTQPRSGAAPVPAEGPATTVAPAPAVASNGHATLLNIPRQTGPQITQHFTVTGARWTLGWAYDCTEAPSGTGDFDIKVFDGSGNSSDDGGINQQGAKGSSVVAYTSTGERYLKVTTNCVWAIRVTT